MEYKRLTNEDLFIFYQEEKSEKLKQELVMRHLHVIESIALSMQDIYINFAELGDVINEGVIVLIKSIDKYDIKQKIKFETYVTKRIRGMILDLARHNDFISRTLRSRFKEIDCTKRNFYTGEGREPTDYELANELDMDVKNLHRYESKRHLSHVASLDSLQDERGDFVFCEGLTPEKEFFKNEERRLLKAAMDEMSETQKQVLSLYYEQELTMREVANILKVSEPRISQIHKEIIEKLKCHL